DEDFDIFALRLRFHGYAPAHHAERRTRRSMAPRNLNKKPSALDPAHRAPLGEARADAQAQCWHRALEGHRQRGTPARTEPPPTPGRHSRAAESQVIADPAQDVSRAEHPPGDFDNARLAPQHPQNDAVVVTPAHLVAEETPREIFA